MRGVLNSEELGAYYTNGAFIVIGSEQPCFEEVSPGRHSPVDANFYIFVHEYYHYLQNFTTIYGLQKFVFDQQVLAVFTKTLNENGECDPQLLEEKDHEALRCLLWELLRSDGQLDHDFNGVFEYGEISILGGEAEPRTFSFGGEIGERHNIAFRLVGKRDGLTEHRCYDFGETAIVEGMAYEIDRFVEGKFLNNPHVEDNSPIFPYIFLRMWMTTDVQNGDSLRVAIVKACILALLTNNPVAQMLNTLQRLGEVDPTGDVKADMDKGFERVWNELEPTLQSFKDVLIGQIESFVEMHKGRGAMEYAIKYIANLYETAIELRLKDPFFDVSAFDSNEFNSEKFMELVKKWVPCIVLQKINHGDSSAEGGVLLAFCDEKIETKSGNSIEVKDLLILVNLQRHYLMSHINWANASFNPSEQVESVCPIFCVCNLPFKDSHMEICSRTPWKSLSLQSAEPKCPYASAVSCAVGPTRI